jgi:hypothetical protein
MTNFKKIFAALALVAASSTVAMAQTDFGSPIGAGGGLGGTIAPFVPGLAGAGTAPGLTGNGATGLNNARNAFGNAGGPNVRLVNPAGGNVNVPTNVVQALAGVLSGAPSANQVSVVTNSMTGVPASTASALVTALTSLGATPNFPNLVRAVQAYNAAIDALPAGTEPPPALAAVRQALFQASRS